MLRLKRLLAGSAAGALGLAGLFAYLVVASPRALADEPEEEAKVVEVELAKPEPEPEPPPPPPATPRPRAPSPGPRMPKLETPTTISDEKPTEKAVQPATSGASDPYAGAGDGSGTAQKAVVEPAAAPPPPPKPQAPKSTAPVPVSEGMTPPEAIVALVKPEYPAEAKAAGLEGTVVVKYVVDEHGNVSEARALKGPPELFAVCVAAVKAMRFKPALDADGKAVAVVRYLKFPFRLRT